MNDDLEQDVDYGSTIDRTIPDGVISVDEEGRRTVLKDGVFVLAELEAE